MGSQWGAMFSCSWGQKLNIIPDHVRYNSQVTMLLSRFKPLQTVDVKYTRAINNLTTTIRDDKKKLRLNTKYLKRKNLH